MIVALQDQKRVGRFRCSRARPVDVPFSVMPHVQVNRRLLPVAALVVQDTAHRSGWNAAYLKYRDGRFDRHVGARRSGGERAFFRRRKGAQLAQQRRDQF